MSNRPWMPFYFGDYLNKTQHLSTLEHGAYFLLIAHYWANDGLPRGDESKRKIAKLSRHNWKKFCPTLRKFFHDNWKHERIDEELIKARSISETRKNAVSKRRDRQATNEPTNEEQKNTHLHSQPHSEKKEDSLRGASAEKELPLITPMKALFTDGRVFLERHGVTEANARSLLGKWKKDFGEMAACEAVTEAMRNEVSEPVAFIIKTLESRHGQRTRNSGSNARGGGAAVFAAMAGYKNGGAHCAEPRFTPSTQPVLELTAKGSGEGPRGPASGRSQG